MSPIELNGFYLTKKMAAEHLDLDVRTVQMHIVNGSLAAIKVGHFWLIELTDLENFTPNKPGNPTWRKD